MQSFSLVQHFSRLSPNARGALWLLASALSFAVMNAMVRGLGSEIHGFQQAFFRCLFGWIALFPFVARQAPQVFVTGRSLVHLARGVVGLTAMLCVFYALTHLPLAEATAFFFAKPLFMIPLALLFLGETVGWRRILATLAGFGGVLVMLDPGETELGAGALAALLAVFLMAVVLVLVKKLTATERAMTMLFYFTGIATLGTFGPALWVWVWPTPTQWGLLAAMGALASGAQYLAVRAYRVGDAAAITPMDYSQLLFAGLLGYLLFGEVPGWNTVAGAAMIAATTLYILRREARLKSPSPAPTDKAAAP